MRVKKTLNVDTLRPSYFGLTNVIYVCMYIGNVNLCRWLGLAIHREWLCMHNDGNNLHSLIWSYAYIIYNICTCIFHFFLRSNIVIRKLWPNLDAFVCPPTVPIEENWSIEFRTHTVRKSTGVFWVWSRDFRMARRVWTEFLRGFRFYFGTQRAAACFSASATASVASTTTTTTTTNSVQHLSLGSCWCDITDRNVPAVLVAVASSGVLKTLTVANVKLGHWARNQNEWYECWRRTAYIIDS